MKFPNESPEYRDARNYLTQLEVAARRALEEAAAARRRLPPGGKIGKDYSFEEVASDGSIRKVKLSELFTPGENSLAIYSWMFNDKMSKPCPMCTSMIDSWDGVVRHVKQRVPLVIVADSPAPRLMAFAKERGWRNLRILSTAGSDYNRDYFGVTPSGDAIPIMNLFRQSPDGIRHFWGTEISQKDVGQDSRGLDTLNPVFQIFDLTPEGRGDFYTKLEYKTPTSL